MVFGLFWQFHVCKHSIFRIEAQMQSEGENAITIKQQFSVSQPLDSF